MPEPPHLGRRFWLLVAASTLCFLTLGVYAASIPRWLEEGGASAATVGAVMAVMPIAAVLTRAPLGRLSDVHGRRRAAVAGAVLSLVGALVLFIGGAPWIVSVSRVFVGFGEALITVACMAWIIDVIPPRRRGRAMSWFGMSVWLGLSLGPQLGELARDVGGFDLVWLFVASACLASALLLTAVPDSHVRHPEGRIEFRIPRAVWMPGSVMGLAVLGEGMLVAFGILHLEDRGIESGPGIGGAASVYSTLALGALLSRPLIATLPDRLGGRVCAMIGTSSIGLGVALIAPAPSFAVAATGAFLMGIGLALMYPALSLIVAAGVEPHDRGVAMGAFTTFVDVGLAAGALAGGVLVGATSTGAAFWVAAVAAALAGMIVSARAPRREAELTARGIS